MPNLKFPSEFLNKNFVEIFLQYLIHLFCSELF